MILLVVTQILFLAPLLAFLPTMARTKRKGLREYSLLVDRYNREFQEKWVASQALVTALPTLPLLLLVMPIEKIIDALAGVAF